MTRLLTGLWKWVTSWFRPASMPLQVARIAAATAWETGARDIPGVAGRVFSNGPSGM